MACEDTQASYLKRMCEANHKKGKRNLFVKQSSCTAGI